MGRHYHQRTNVDKPFLLREWVAWQLSAHGLFFKILQQRIAHLNHLFLMSHTLLYPFLIIAWDDIWYSALPSIRPSLGVIIKGGATLSWSSALEKYEFVLLCCIEWFDGNMESHNRADVVISSDSRAHLPAPGYADLVTQGYSVVRGAMRDCTNCDLELSKRTFCDNACLTWNEVGIVCLCAVLWTITRRTFTACFSQVTHYCSALISWTVGMKLFYFPYIVKSHCIEN